MFPELRAACDRESAISPKDLATADDVADLIADTVLYRYYGWLERHLQRFKYSGRYGLVPYHAQRRKDLEAALDPRDLPAGLLDLDPGFELPKYYTSVDIHQHPGGGLGRTRSQAASMSAARARRRRCMGRRTRTCTDG